MSGRGVRRGGGVRGGGASPSVRGRGSSVRGGGNDASFSPMSAYLQPTPVGQYRRSSSTDLQLTRVLAPLHYNIPIIKNRYEMPQHGPVPLMENQRPGGLRHAKTPSELLSVSVHSFPAMSSLLIFILLLF